MEGKNLADHMRVGAEEFAQVATEEGYALDFTPGSVANVERMIEEVFTASKRFGRGKADRPDPQFSNMAPRVGAYVGEVIVRNHNGRWDSHPDFGPGVVIDENWLFPLGKAQQRFENGPEDNVEVFYKVVTRDL